ncbi:interleukin-17 receptor E [Engraulis encrasicolus]|uniref:interleukin-17 receptor E n=1 Tax=Engraulis encrasicolus TaxID=184585 RepID=UPI002FD5DC80
MTEGVHMVTVRLCYKRSSTTCLSLSPPVEFETNATNPFPTIVRFPHMLPCLCIQMFSSLGYDTERRTICPLENITEEGITDVWSYVDIIYNNSTLALHWLCPSTTLMPSVSLCWNTSRVDCLALPNTRLQGADLNYDVSAMDRHPQLCIKFSLNKNQHVHCPFGHGHLWDVTSLAVTSGHLRVSITSKITASYAAVLCTPADEECSPLGNEHFISMKGDSAADLMLPLPFSFAKLCVQVWRFEPLLLGRRIHCLDDPQVHRRGGLIFGAALAFMLTLVILGGFACQQLSKKLSGFCLNRPILLVSSSEECGHVSSVLALASGLKAELQCSVRLALWDQCSSQASIAHLGPVPWLHAQCQAVLQAGGMVLIAWHTTTRDTTASDSHKRRHKAGRREDTGHESRRVECEHSQLTSYQCRKNHSTCECHPEDCTLELKAETGEMNGAPPNTEMGDGAALLGCDESKRDVKTSVTGVVLDATLSYVQAARQSNHKSANFAVLHFSASKDESETDGTLSGLLQTLPSYNLPKDLPELVLELSLGPSRHDGRAGGQRAFKRPHCWLWLPGLYWAQQVSWRIAQRLQNAQH